MAREQLIQKYAKSLTLIYFLQDADSEIVTQAAKMLGDVKYAEAGDTIASTFGVFRHLRVQLHAIEALGRIEYQISTQPILDMFC